MSAVWRVVTLQPICWRARVIIGLMVLGCLLDLAIHVR